jgi:cell division protein FtsB
MRPTTAEKIIDKAVKQLQKQRDEIQRLVAENNELKQQLNDATAKLARSKRQQFLRGKI